MPEKLQRLTFRAETDERTATTVRLRYVMDEETELVITREWWEQLGSPEAVDLTIEPVE